LLVQPTALVGEVLSTIAVRVNAGGDVSSLGTVWQRSVLASGRAEHSAFGGVGWWVLTLASLLALLAIGGAASRVARRPVWKATPELIVLLNQSAAFYGRWPEDRLASAPRDEVVLEAARCRRIVELLERRTAPGIDRGPAENGPIAGLQAWIALLSKRIDGRHDVPSGTAYA
jgi:hypothetical protein